MKKVLVSDITLRKARISFREKVEAAKLIDRLKVDVIETDGIENGRSDVLLLKSVSQAVKNAVLSVPVKCDGSDVSSVYDAIKEAPGKRLRVVMPVSVVQMEYLTHKKPDAFLAEVLETVKKCRELTDDVELCLQDATRADTGFLKKVTDGALSEGVSTVCLCDNAGLMLSGEFESFLDTLYGECPALKELSLSLYLSNTLSQAQALCIAGILKGACEIKASVTDPQTVLLTDIVKTIDVKRDTLEAFTEVDISHLSGIQKRLAAIMEPEGKDASVLAGAMGDGHPESMLGPSESEKNISDAVKSMGYDLSCEDDLKVYDEFRKLSSKKGAVSTKELDAIVAAVAMQVPERYRLSNYTVTSGNQTGSMCRILLLDEGKAKEGVSLGEGPIDAAFRAIENVTGTRYELDDFQIQAITEGREALGQTIVRLRAGGRIYSGRGLSVDIVGSGITAYLNALNKIVFEEQEE